MHTPVPVSRPVHIGLAAFILGVHAAALGVIVASVLAFVRPGLVPGLLPYVFSWEAFISFFLLSAFTGMVGITVGFHRKLTHQGFETPKWLEWILATAGMFALQGSVARWIETHRVHHIHSDEEGDPHSPIHGWLWAHMTWLFVYFTDEEIEASVRKYAKDILKDPYYSFMHYHYWIVVPISVLLIGATGYAYGHAWGGMHGGLASMSAFVLWAFVVRVVFVWNITWCVNSVTHIWGYRNYETTDNSRNNPIIGILGFGEGWHNNHHADQVSAKHGHTWWEIDVSYWFICTLWFFGLAWDIKLPRQSSA